MAKTETILISVPYYKCKDVLERAIRSLLAQTHRDFLIIIGNDGDTPPDISIYNDDRVLLYNFPENNGRYFVDCCTLKASPFKYYSVHDADDYSKPDRLERLFYFMKDQVQDAIISHQMVRGMNGNRQMEYNEALDMPLDRYKMQWLGHHAGIYTKECLDAIGGFNPEFRVGYDTLMTNLIKGFFRIYNYPSPLYHRIARANSLVRSPETGFGSAHRREASRRLDEMYLKCFHASNLQEVRDIVQTKNKSILEKVEFHSKQISKLLNDHLKNKHNGNKDFTAELV